MRWYFLSASLTLLMHAGGAHIYHIASESTTNQDAIVYIFAHGLASTYRQGLHSFCKNASLEDLSIYNPYWMLGSPALLFNFPDAKSDNKIQWHADQVNLGQEHDVQALAQAYAYARTCYPNAEYVLRGVSRGAATILNFLGTVQPVGIRAAVLECPFDCFEAVVNHLLQQACVSWIPYSEKLAKKYMSYIFPRIKTAGLVPKHIVHAIDQRTALLLLHSTSDSVVPISASRNLYCLLRNAGHAHVHLCEFQTGKHAALLKSSEAHLAHSVIQSFYKYYNLPHDSQAADFSYEYFIKHCQPDIKQVKKRMKQTRMLLQTDAQHTLLESLEH